MHPLHFTLFGKIGHNLQQAGYSSFSCSGSAPSSCPQCQNPWCHPKGPHGSKAKRRARRIRDHGRKCLIQARMASLSPFTSIRNPSSVSTTRHSVITFSILSHLLSLRLPANLGICHHLCYNHNEGMCPAREPRYLAVHSPPHVPRPGPRGCWRRTAFQWADSKSAHCLHPMVKQYAIAAQQWPLPLHTVRQKALA